MHKKLALGIAASAITAGALTLTSAPALAQPQLASVDPPAGSRLANAPQVIRLCFTEPISVASTAHYRLTLTDAQGLPLPIVIAPSGGNSCLEVRPQWPAQPRGTYSLFYQVRSAATGQVSTGTISLQVGLAGARPDLLRYTALTAAAAAGACLVGLLLAGVRRLVGYEPHRPRRSAEASTSSHH